MRCMAVFAVAAAVGLCAATKAPVSTNFEPLAATSSELAEATKRAPPANVDASPELTEASPNQANGEPSWTDKVGAITAALVALFTAVLTWVGLQQWHLLRTSTSLSIKALEAAQRSAEAATAAAVAAEKGAAVAERALIDVQRPFLFQQIDDFGLIDRADDYVPWVRVQLQNIGQQPAIIQMCRGELRLWPSGVPPKFDAVPLDFDLATDPIVGPLVLPINANQELRLTRPIVSREVAEQFRRKELQLYARLLIRYRDPLGTVRASAQTWIFVREADGKPAEFKVQPYAESTYDRHIGQQGESDWF